MTTKQQHVSRFLEAPVVRMLRIRSASLKIPQIKVKENLKVQYKSSLRFYFR